MILYPAIDIFCGKAVRLTKGDFDAKKVYDEDPYDAAAGWVQQGAQYLHVVDLDGAKEGATRNLAHLERIAGKLGVPVQYGGGLRDLPAVQAALDAGARRAVLGTAALKDPAFLGAALRRWPERVVVSVDVRGGRVATAGWTQTIGSTAVEAAGALRKQGVRDLVYTDVDRDGMLEGPDLEGTRAIARAVDDGSVICSGGVGSLQHLAALAALQEPAIGGVIVGKALYERRFTVAQALRALAG